jgi:hypothetical protein
MRLRASAFVALLLLATAAAQHCPTEEPSTSPCSGRGVCLLDSLGQSFCSCDDGWTGEATNLDCVTHTTSLRVIYGALSLWMLAVYAKALLKMREIYRWVRARRMAAAGVTVVSPDTAGTARHLSVPTASAAGAGPAQPHSPQVHAHSAFAAGGKSGGGAAGAGAQSQQPLWREAWATHQFQNVFWTSLPALTVVLWYWSRAFAAQRTGYDWFATATFALLWPHTFLSRMWFTYATCRLHLNLAALSAGDHQSGRS